MPDHIDTRGAACFAFEARHRVCDYPGTPAFGATPVSRPQASRGSQRFGRRRPGGAPGCLRNGAPHLTWRTWAVAGGTLLGGEGPFPTWVDGAFHRLGPTPVSLEGHAHLDRLCYPLLSRIRHLFPGHPSDPAQCPSEWEGAMTLVDIPRHRRSTVASHV